MPNKKYLSLNMACYRAVHDYPGGVPAVAGVFGWNSSTLQNKLNPTQHHALTVTEMQDILQLTKSPEIMDAACNQINAVWASVENLGDASDVALLDNVTASVVKVGDLSLLVQESLADGNVTDDELVELESAAMKCARAAFRIVQRMKQFR